KSLMAYHWPGNGRELRNAVERALIFHKGGPLAVCEPPVEWDLPDEASGFEHADVVHEIFGGDQATLMASGGHTAPPDTVRLPLGLTLAEVERQYIEARIHGRPADYATLASGLGISRKTLWKKRLEYGLSIQPPPTVVGVYDSFRS